MTQFESPLFDAAKEQIIRHGRATRAEIDAATQKVICIDGLWARDGRLLFDYPAVGWIVDGKIVAVKAVFDFPKSENPDHIKTALQARFPGARVIVTIT